MVYERRILKKKSKKSRKFHIYEQNTKKSNKISKKCEFILRRIHTPKKF